MHKTFTKELIQSLKVITLGLALGVGINYAFAVDWTPPTANPPANNAAAPINVSTSAQTKGTSANGINFLVGSSALSATSSTGPGVAASTSAPTSRAIVGIGGISVLGNANFGLGDIVFGLAGSSNSGFSSDFYNQVNITPTGFGNPLSINLGSNTGPNGRNAIWIDGSDDQDSVGISTDKNKFWFYSSNNQGVTLEAKKIKLNDGTQGTGKILTSDANGLSSWNTPATPSVTVQSPTPDIIMMEESWADINDGQSRSIHCPADYAAIAVACDTNKDDGADTCLIYDKGGSYDYNGRQTGNDVGYQASFKTDPNNIDYNYYGAIISPANDNANIHVWLTCMRFRNYPVILANVSNQQIGTWSAGVTSSGYMGETCQHHLIAQNHIPYNSDYVSNVRTAAGTVGKCDYHSNAQGDFEEVATYSSGGAYPKPGTQIWNP